MRLLLPRSLGGQTLAVLVCTLVVSHLIGIAVYSLDRRAAVISTEARDFAERVVGMVNLIRHLPKELQGDVVRESDGRSFHVTMDRIPDAPGEDRDASRSDDVATYLKRQLPDWPPGDILVSFAETPLIPGDTAAASADEGTPMLLHISIRLGEEGWLNFVGGLPDVRLIWFLPASAYILTMTVGVGLASIWLVFRVTAPLTAFARAADRLGRDIRTEPLPEAGPEEVVQAAQAFNAMQKRVTRLVENRTQILAALSHDLRTPVTLLRLRAELMDETEERAKILGTIADMETMIESVLEFTKATLLNETRRSVDLSALLSSICDDMTDAGYAVEFEPAETISYTCRRIGMKRALTNLIDNAVKYGKAAHVVLERRRSAVVIEISDEGPGIPEDRLDAIFMPFYRIDESRSEGAGGMGLGLSIAQAIIHGHGGQIQLENRPEGGLTARILLPA